MGTGRDAVRPQPPSQLRKIRPIFVGQGFKGLSKTFGLEPTLEQDPDLRQHRISGFQLDLLHINFLLRPPKCADGFGLYVHQFGAEGLEGCQCREISVA